MAIKKRRSLPTAEAVAEAEKPQPLNIVAKPKTPIPAGGVLRELAGADATPLQVRHVGAVISSIERKDVDEHFTPEDRVTAMRSCYDAKNPQELRYRARVRNRGTAITAMCIVCQGGRKAVTECIDTTCPLWAFRFGSDPFYGKRGK